MQMQLGIDSQIPDGLLAANALLAENSRQGVPTSTHTLHRGFEFAISSTYKGFQFRCSESASDPVVAPSNRTPNKITCGTVLPNGRTVGSYVNQLSNGINGSAGNPTSTPYGPGPNPSAPGPLTVASQVYSGTNFKIMFRGQGNAAFLGDAGNFAYAAVSGNIGVPLWATEAVAGGYALWAGHQDANGPWWMDASATAQVPAGYSAGCKTF
jgi:hypothetical protein